MVVRQPLSLNCEDRCFFFISHNEKTKLNNQSQCRFSFVFFSITPRSYCTYSNPKRLKEMMKHNDDLRSKCVNTSDWLINVASSAALEPPALETHFALAWRMFALAWRIFALAWQFI